MPRRTIVHLIGNLQTAGVEHVLCNLLSRSDPTWARMEVITLLAEGPLATRMRAQGIRVRSLGYRDDVGLAKALTRLNSWLRHDPPHLLVCWMYHANLIGAMVRAMATPMPIIWNIHNSTLEPDASKRSTRAIARLGGCLARWIPDKVVYCSHVAEKLHIQMGYGRDNSLVIPNGFDTTVLRPQPAARLAVRRELGVPDDCPLLGSVGRFHPQKDHHNFLKAAAQIKQSRPDVHFLLCGDGVEQTNSQLSRWIEDLGLQTNCHLLGRRNDVSRLHAAIDLLVSASACGEAFPLVIGEAMACGVPCVVTDVGDSALLVGDTGRIVPAKTSHRLAQACLDLLSLSSEVRSALGAQARQRILTHFPLDRIAARYFELWEQTAAHQAVQTPKQQSINLESTRSSLSQAA